MTPCVQALYDLILAKKHHLHRRDCALRLAEDFSARRLSPTLRMRERFVRLLAEERPVLLPGERIALTRTVRNLPDIFTQAEWADIQKHRLHEVGFVCNISPGYAQVIVQGLEYYRQKALAQLQKSGFTDAQREFFSAVIADIEAVYDLCDRYAVEAKRQGNAVVAALFAKLPREGASSFHEALQLFRILHFMLWLEGEYHNTIGRFDQYMYPYLQRDLDAGILTQDEAFDLLAEFFLTFNRDSDLYPSVQQGDNGQSMVLGGITPNGHEGYNLLSELCLRASCELKLIDPKINLRVSKSTPPEVFELGTELTRQGLGFPQYSNDDVVIPGLLAKGYDLADARGYVVAACWEFIIPRVGMDIPNIDALSYPAAVDKAFHRALASANSFADFQASVHAEITAKCREMIANTRNLWIIPAPFLSIMMDSCIDSGNDISQGGTYNNYGFHGTGLATAADSLAAIRQLVFEEKAISAQEYIRAVDSNFEGCDALLHRLRTEMPKMGNNDDAVDSARRRADGLLRGRAGGRKQRTRRRLPRRDRLRHVLSVAHERNRRIPGRTPQGGAVRRKLRTEPFRQNQRPAFRPALIYQAQSDPLHQRRAADDGVSRYAVPGHGKREKNCVPRRVFRRGGRTSNPAERREPREAAGCAAAPGALCAADCARLGLERLFHRAGQGIPGPCDSQAGVLLIWLI